MKLLEVSKRCPFPPCLFSLQLLFSNFPPNSLLLLILHPRPVSFPIHCSNSNLSSITPQQYVYPDPIPEFAQSETLTFRTELLKKLSREKETFRDDLVRVADVCAEISSEFLHKEYGGAGALLVEPFTDMLVALKEKKLAGAPFSC